jgi:hypothetical protein
MLLIKQDECLPVATVDRGLSRHLAGTISGHRVPAGSNIIEK